MLLCKALQTPLNLRSAVEMKGLPTINVMPRPQMSNLPGVLHASKALPHRVFDQSTDLPKLTFKAILHHNSPLNHLSNQNDQNDRGLSRALPSVKAS